MLVQPYDADRAYTTPAGTAAHSPYGITVRAGDLSTRHDRAEYIYNVYGTWRRRHRFEAWL